MTSKRDKSSGSEPTPQAPKRDRSAEYKRDYQRRLEKARQAHHANRREFDKARGIAWAKAPRDSQKEYDRQRALAREQGFSTVSERKRYLTNVRRGEVRSIEDFTQKTFMLAKFGVSEREFNMMRQANLAYQRPKFENWKPKGEPARQRDRKKAIGLALRINEYDVDRDLDPGDWSERRVGYIVSFYRAIVDPQYNYDSLVDPKTGMRRIWRKRHPLTNRAQADYLVKYAEIMEISEFERRYGAQVQF